MTISSRNRSDLYETPKKKPMDENANGGSLAQSSSSGLITPVTPATSTANNLNVLSITSSPTSAALTPSKAKRRSSTGSNKIDVNDFIDNDPQMLAELQPYLDGIDDSEPNFTMAALIRCFFGYQNQKISKLYIMAQKGSKIAVRFGTSWDVEQRRNQHVQERTIGGVFVMYVSPLGEQNLLVVMDLEYACIQLSRQKLIKFYKENLNSDLDVGRVNSSFLEAIIQQPDHSRRAWLITAVNQLIKCTFAHGDIV
uniref:Protein kinase domain-containing protein n=1 Tax=Panagrolaimus sp. ES5 TaxID=591445 RepID=A0AC34G9A7_9BILA